MYTIDSKGKIIAHFKKIEVNGQTMLSKTGIDNEPSEDQVMEKGWALISTSRAAGLGSIKWLQPDVDAPIEDNIERLRDELYNLGYRKNRRGRWVKP